jgi:hypothetical protein
MNDKKPRTFQELASANVFDLKDSEIRSLIAECQAARFNYLQSVSPNVNSLTQQLELAQHELSARQSTRMARLSLLLSTIAIVASAASFIA